FTGSESSGSITPTAVRGRGAVGRVSVAIWRFIVLALVFAWFIAFVVLIIVFVFGAEWRFFKIRLVIGFRRVLGEGIARRRFRQVVIRVLVGVRQDAVALRLCQAGDAERRCRCPYSGWRRRCHRFGLGLAAHGGPLIERDQHFA